MGASEAAPGVLPLDPAIAVGMVGAGTMGAGIAQIAAMAGHPVFLFDTRNGAAQAAIASIEKNLDKLVAKQRLSKEAAEKSQQNLHAVASIEELANCGLVIEAIVEDLAAKRGLFRALENVLAGDAILATNTSSISITAIGEALLRPERLVGMHFFNPAPLMPLVEIVRGDETSSDVANTLYATALAWGKTPVHARSTPGFIVNRVARPFYAEALLLLSEQAADCATIDAILRESGGFRMGPFELMDLIGLDVNYAVTASVFEGFHRDARFTPSPLQLELVQAGLLGRKSGRGFYDYATGAEGARPNTMAAQSPPRKVQLYGEDALVRAVTAKLANTSVLIEHEPPHVDGRLIEGDAFVLYRTDGRTAAQRGLASGVKDTVLVDLALNDEAATRLALTAFANASPDALTSAAGLLQAAGYVVSAIEDVPGMIVLRTVAMLANFAADAVDQGVCTPADADLAMCKGVNYPCGPLAWGDAIGRKTVVQTLEQLAQAYGAERYRVSPLLRSRMLAGTSLREQG